MANKIKASKMPTSALIDNADVLRRLIKAKRTEMGIKLSDCAALCGIGINTLSRIENGNSNCTLSATFSVLNGLGIKLITRESGVLESNLSNDEEWV